MRILLCLFWQWDKYLENIAKADCAAALRRVLSSPPQINVKDAGLKCEGQLNSSHCGSSACGARVACVHANADGNLVAANLCAPSASRELASTSFRAAAVALTGLELRAAGASKDAECCLLHAGG